MTSSTSPTSSGSSADGRLVEEHQLRVHRQRPGDGHPLLLATGELRRVGRRLVAEADLLEQLERLRRGVLLLARP